jgi:hypothetical protein
MVPEMIREFFRGAGGSAYVTLEGFRPNCDYFVSAERA